METAENSALIEEYRQLTFNPHPEITLDRPCKLEDGIIRHSDFEKNKFKLVFDNTEQKISFFIPASGSGSRMFKFLYEFLEDPTEETRSKTERFLSAITSFAFFELLPYSLKKRVKNFDINIDEFITYLLKPEGLGLGTLPKGLIPFHRSRSFILNAFQEQFLQGLMLKDEEIHFHFTINKKFENEIENSLKAIQHLTGRNCKVNWSEQDPATNSIAFDDEKNPVRNSKGEILTRPSGHGALLSNLNAIDSDIIFIKNIDNIQHEVNAEEVIHHLKYIGGLLHSFKTELKAAYQSDNTAEQLHLLNEKYQFTSPDTQFAQLSKEEIKMLVNKPIRVCGMVRNEGQPGGGPFWVKENGVVSKQIVEKSQINNKGDQYKVMVRSQYFNPVLMAISTKNIEGKQLDLKGFADTEKYFKVAKTHHNRRIHFIEKPGLWNGSMANWISIFVEAPSATFTPVKTALDLLNKAHYE